MSIKDMLRVYPHDKLSHYQWASWFAAAAAIIAVAAVLLLTGMPLPIAALAGAGASVAVAVLAGVAGEYMDKRANDAAIAVGAEPTRAVSEGDVIASALGASPSALPLLALAALTWPGS